MTDNTLTLTVGQARALRDVLRSEVERTELIVFCERVLSGHFGPLTNGQTVTYDLGVDICANDDCSGPGEHYWGQFALCSDCFRAPGATG
jgi:hypothetical protein